MHEIKELLGMLGMLLAWAFATIVMLVFLAAVASWAARSEFVDAREFVKYADKDGWDVSIEHNNDVKRVCKATKFVTNTIVAEIEYDKEAPLLRITGARFLVGQDDRALASIDNNRPMPITATTIGVANWAAKFYLPPTKETWNQLRRGATLVLVVSQRKLEVPLRGTSWVLDQLEKCDKEGQEFLDRRLVRLAEPVEVM